ncbi:transcriptional regulator, GntR family with aminotransferase domain [Anaeromyxobacter sp. K]|uniref:MocR-like pyridoxine biosynthesis transcription factor PdxR n=1 Tax=Anaeromyxobacter sp. (strain K) TaxID=447217 RepID=UPI00015F8AA7|nr:PLP-dependent aminotransferase family protein [Anaeromyxobacter sp. K]ACG72870.1 transcriptional regulator, GntR family with aminotransferase domain [Anaeromyxobacter sp. K]
MDPLPSGTVDLHVSLHRRGRLAADAYRQLREAILDGRLRAGERLPATRDLARRLDVSRNTVLHAYQRLAAEGYLVGRAGAGTYVAEGVRADAGGRRAPAGAALRPRAGWASMPAPAAPPPRPAPYDFQVGAPDPALFPWDAWRWRVSRQLRGRRAKAGYPPPEGDPGARAAVARHLGVARSVRAGAEDVILTSGAQQALDLVGRVLLAPGDRVALEDPGYPPARAAFEALGARAVPVRVDAEGLVVEALPADVRLVYVTPSHQFPLGMPMSLRRRQALLAWSERTGAAIVEDDYDSEFRFDGRPLEPLQALDRQGRVVYVGSLSKVLLPTLRLGFLVAPASLVPALRAAKALADSHGPLELQRALAELVDDGLLARHVRRVLRVYRERRDRLAAAVERHLAGRVIALPASAGLHWSFLLADAGADEAGVVRRAQALGVAVQPLAPYHARPGRPGFALGYGIIPAARIDEGVRRLAAALEPPPAPRPRR